jgi:hypothetical protein
MPYAAISPPADRPAAWAVLSCRAGQPYAPSVNVLVRVADMPAAEFKLGSKERSR